MRLRPTPLERPDSKKYTVSAYIAPPPSSNNTRKTQVEAHSDDDDEASTFLASTPDFSPPAPSPPNTPTTLKQRPPTQTGNEVTCYAKAGTTSLAPWRKKNSNVVVLDELVIKEHAQMGEKGLGGIEGYQEAADASNEEHGAWRNKPVIKAKRRRLG